MKRGPRSLLVPALLVAGILMVAANAWMAFRSVESLLGSERLVEHTWQVVNQVERVMGSAKDAETGVRGFLVTKDPAYLDPYRTAKAELPLELGRLRELTADNPGQGRRLTEMESVLSERLRLLEQSASLRRMGDEDTLHALTLSGTGKMQMDRLRRLADDAEAEERRLLTIRTEAARSSGRRARITVALASLLDLLLIVLMFRTFYTERALRIETENAAERLAESRAEVEARAAEIQLLNATLEQRVQQRTAELETTNRELEAFSYSVSHDLRAPLRTIDGFSLALEEDYAEAVDAVGRDYIARVRAGVQRMGMLIDALLQLSRITRAEIVREKFDLSALARAVAAPLRDSDPARAIQIKVEDGLRTHADPKLVEVALENLLGNAVKFSSKMERAVVEFGWDAGEKAWFVRDNGAGFDMYYAGKLFHAFNRLHGDKDFKGSGIGLATVARVVHRHHGRIWAEGAVGRGATFWFTLG